MSEPRRPGRSQKPGDYVKPRRFADTATYQEITKAAPVETKSQEEYDTVCRQIKAKARDIQNKLDSFMKDWADFEHLTLRAYKKMPKPDALFTESPFGPLRLFTSMRLNLAKQDVRWASTLLVLNPDGIKPFFDHVADACTWGDRINHDEERKQKIAQAEADIEKSKQALGSIS